MKELERVMKGLANRRRLLIIRHLHAKREASVADIANAINLSFTSTSKHLNLLHRLDIVDRRQESLTVYYSIAKSPPTLLKLVVPLISNSRE